MAEKIYFMEYFKMWIIWGIPVSTMKASLRWAIDAVLR
jgi:hypothetical protein